MKNEDNFLIDIIKVRDGLTKDNPLHKQLTELHSNVIEIHARLDSTKEKLHKAEAILKDDYYKEIFKEAMKENLPELINQVKKSTIKTTSWSILAAVVITIISFLASNFSSEKQYRDVSNKISEQTRVNNENIDKRTAESGSRIIEYITSRDIYDGTTRYYHKKIIEFIATHGINKLNKDYISLIYKTQFLVFDPTIERSLFIEAINKFLIEQKASVKISNNDILRWENEFMYIISHINELFKENIEKKYNAAEFIYDKFKSPQDETDYRNFTLPLFKLGERMSLEEVHLRLNMILYSLKIKNGLYPFNQ